MLMIGDSSYLGVIPGFLQPPQYNPWTHTVTDPASMKRERHGNVPAESQDEPLG